VDAGRSGGGRNGTNGQSRKVGKKTAPKVTKKRNEEEKKREDMKGETTVPQVKTPFGEARERVQREKKKVAPANRAKEGI